MDVNLTGMFLCIRQAFKLMKAQDEADRDRDAIGATAHSAAVVRPFGDVDWQMTEGGEWYRTNAEPELLSGGGGAGAGVGVLYGGRAAWEWLTRAFDSLRCRQQSSPLPPVVAVARGNATIPMAFCG